MESRVSQLVVFFLVGTAAVYAGNYLYSLRNKARIAPPDTTSVLPN